MRKKILVLVSLVFSGSVFAEVDMSSQIEQNYKNIKNQVCDKLDLSVNIKTSPLLYTDPLASCDLGFDFPSFPDFSFSFDGLDSCKLLQSVTGDLVGKINNAARETVNGALEEIGLEDGQIDIDFGDLIIDKTGKGGN